MKEKWTKGPWEFLEGHDNFCGLYEQSAVLGTIKGGDDCDMHICRIWNDINDDDEMIEERANAHLIAAAPDLYAVLKAIIDDLPISRDWLDPVNERWAKDTLKKARGES